MLNQANICPRIEEKTNSPTQFVLTPALNPPKKATTLRAANDNAKAQAK